jgi:hypothetical protein
MALDLTPIEEEETVVDSAPLSPTPVEESPLSLTPVESPSLSLTPVEEEKGFFTSVWDELEQKSKEHDDFYYSEDVPMSDKAKRFFADGVVAPVMSAIGGPVGILASPFIASEIEETPAQLLGKATMGGVIRGATLGYVDVNDEDLNEKLKDANLDFTGEVATTLGDLTGITLPFLLGGGAVRAVTGRAGVGSAGATSKVGRFAKGVLEDTLLGASLGAVEHIEDNESRTDNIIQNAAIFGGLGVVARTGVLATTIAGAGVGAGVGAATGEDIAESAVIGGSVGLAAGIAYKSFGALMKRNTTEINNTIKEGVQTSAKVHKSYADSQTALSVWSKPEVRARTIYIPKDAKHTKTRRNLSKVRNVVSNVQKDELKAATLQEQITAQVGTYNSKLKSVQNDIQKFASIQKDRGLKPAVLKNKFNSLKKEARSINRKMIPLNKKKQELRSLLKNIDERKASSEYTNALNILNTGATKQVGVAEKLALSNKSVATDPKVVTHMLESGGISKREAGLLTAKDVRRLSTKADAGNPNGLYNRVFVRPVEKAAAEYSGELQAVTDEFAGMLRNAQLVKPGIVGKGFNTKAYQSYKDRSSRMFDYAEGKISLKEAGLTAEEQTVVGYVKDTYASMLKSINTVRVKHALKPIPERKDYMTHVKEMTLLQDMGINIGNAETKALNSVVASSQNPVFRFAKARTGGEFDKDIISSFQSYINPAMRSIHFTTPGAQNEAYAAILKSSEKPGLVNLGNYYDQWTRDTLYSNSTGLDKAISEWGGDAMLATFDTINRLTSKGAILGNVSTMALQPSTLLSTVSLSGKRSLATFFKVMKPESNAFIMKNSKEMAMREMSLEISESAMSKVENGFNYVNKAIDLQMVKHAWMSGYEKMVSKGFGHDAAVRYGDYLATTTQATYNKMFTPAIMRHKLFKPFSQFQTFGFNLWNTLVADTQNVAAHQGKKVSLKRLAKLTAGMVGTNAIYEEMGLPSPYEITLPVGYDEKGFKWQPEKMSAGIIPVVSGVGKFGPSISVRLGTSIAKLISTDDPTERKRALKSLAKVGPLLIPMGNQIKKTTEGLMAVADGSFSIGQKEIKIEGLTEQARAILLGPRRTVAATKHYESKKNKKPKKKKKFKRYN